MRYLLAILLLASTAAAECPAKPPTRNYAEMRCQSTGRTSWIETTYYYDTLSDCTRLTVAIVTRELTCDGRRTYSCSGMGCPDR